MTVQVVEGELGKRPMYRAGDPHRGKGIDVENQGVVVAAAMNLLGVSDELCPAFPDGFNLADAAALGTPVPIQVIDGSLLEVAMRRAGNRDLAQRPGVGRWAVVIAAAVFAVGPVDEFRSGEASGHGGSYEFRVSSSELYPAGVLPHSGQGI